MKAVDPRILKIAKRVHAKRAKTVIDHILKHGQITTEELRDIYGYNHPPRAARDVREQGIPLDTVRVMGKDGRRIGAYRFGNPDNIEWHKLGGRKTFSKSFKEILIKMYGQKCAITGEKYKSRYLQIDHRIPYEIAGDETGDEESPDKFMLLSGATQRQKSWSCENCLNLNQRRDIEICKECYWSSPEEYTHIAMLPIRQVEIVWSGSDVELYEDLDHRSKEQSKSIQQFIKDVLQKYLY